ncbi:MAG: hypothetical protein K6F53_05505, partial [Lachnospiraceae bacterium]|nr:hypothetical protein [Lachnospiraceae bacterium]
LITATIGNVTFPADADDYEKLFSLMDKALYHGKRRGRNCYTIYDREKHANLEVRSLAKSGIYTSMRELSKLFAGKSRLIDRLGAVMPVLNDGFQIHTMYYAFPGGEAVNVLDPSDHARIGDISSQIMDDIVLFDSVDDLREACPAFHKALTGRNAVSVLIIRIGTADEPSGYRICPEKRRHRIRQEDEYGILYFLSSLAAGV